MTKPILMVSLLKFGHRAKWYCGLCEHLPNIFDCTILEASLYTGAFCYIDDIVKVGFWRKDLLVFTAEKV